jgi:acyl-coenzyme A thioesterase PaaI-like protein
MPKGWAVVTLDFTIKMTGVAEGEALRAKGRVLHDGRTNSIGAADVYVLTRGTERPCGTVLATTRNFKVK